MLIMQNHRQEPQFSDIENPGDTQREKREGGKSQNGLKNKRGLSRKNIEATHWMYILYLKVNSEQFIRLKKVLDDVILALIQESNIPAQNFMGYIREKSAKLEPSKRMNVDQI